MKIFNLKEMTRGWIVGDFEPSVIKTDKCEVGIKTYEKGQKEERHVHLLADEVTVIISGKVKMDGKEFSTNDIILIPKGDSVEFECVEDAVTVVYKSISAKNDKYLT